MEFLDISNKIVLLWHWHMRWTKVHLRPKSTFFGDSFFFTFPNCTFFGLILEFYGNNIELHFVAKKTNDVMGKIKTCCEFAFWWESPDYITVEISFLFSSSVNELLISCPKIFRNDFEFSTETILEISQNNIWIFLKIRW